MSQREMIYVLLLSIQQSGNLDVVVPPDILNSPEISADESVTNEGGNVQLMCQATGVPEPRLVATFRRATRSFNLRHPRRINDLLLFS